MSCDAPTTCLHRKRANGTSAYLRAAIHRRRIPERGGASNLRDEIFGAQCYGERHQIKELE